MQTPGFTPFIRKAAGAREAPFWAQQHLPFRGWSPFFLLLSRACWSRTQPASSPVLWLLYLLLTSLASGRPKLREGPRCPRKRERPSKQGSRRERPCAVPAQAEAGTTSNSPGGRPVTGHHAGHTPWGWPCPHFTHIDELNSVCVFTNIGNSV